MEITSIVGFGIVTVALVLLLRQYRPEYAMLVSVLAGLMILTMIVVQLAEVTDEIAGLVDLTNIDSGYLGVVFKALGICFITQIACDTCNDSGQSAIASKIEMAGKLAVLVVSLPLFRAMVAIVIELIGAS